MHLRYHMMRIARRRAAWAILAAAFAAPVAFAQTAYYRHVVFDNSAHMPHLEETASYLATLRDFLHRVDCSHA